MTASLGLGALLTLCGAASAASALETAPGVELGAARDEPLALTPVEPESVPVTAVAPTEAVAIVPAAASVVHDATMAVVVSEANVAPTAVTREVYASLNDAGSAAGRNGTPMARITVPEPARPDGESPEANPVPEDVLVFDGMRVPRRLVETILKAAAVTGVDPVYMMALADKESSFLPSNKASTSSAEGLFQFVDATWLEMVKRFGPQHGLAAEAQAIEGEIGSLSIPDEATRENVLNLRRDPYLSALMAGEMSKRDRGRIERRLGRPITHSEFYLAHFFGAESAWKFMSLLGDKPRQSAPKTFPAAAKANKSLFYGQNGRKTRQLSVAEVFDRIDAMIDRRLGRYETVMRFASAEAAF